MGTSTSPEFFIFPVRAKTLVPLESSVPIFANHCPPLFMMTGIFAHVSTLLITVGLPQTPLTAGKGGAGFWHPPFTVDGGDKGCFFTADKGAGAEAFISISKLKAGAGGYHPRGAPRFPSHSSIPPFSRPGSIASGVLRPLCRWYPFGGADYRYPRILIVRIIGIGGPPSEGFPPVHGTLPGPLSSGITRTTVLSPFRRPVW